MNITETVIKAKESDTEAISILYNEYKNKIYFLCLRFMGNKKDAGIVLQYTFFQAFHKLAVLKNPENFGMWLYIIAANRCRVLLRDKYPMLFTHDDNEKQTKVKVTYKNNAEILSAASADPEARDALLQITDRLPDIIRMSVILYFYCRMSFAQIAKIMEYDESRIKRQLFEADTQIKKETDIQSAKIERLKEFSGIEEIGIVLHSAADITPVPEDLSENIVATSATLAASAAGYPYLDGKDKSQIRFSDGDNDPKVKTPREVKPLTDIQRTALRNIITIGIVLVLAVSIIIGAVFVIKKAADGIAMATNVGTSSPAASADITADSGSDPVSSDDITADPVTEPAKVTTESVSEVTAPIVTEAPATEAPVTEAPVTEAPANNDGTSILFDSEVKGNEVTISKYTGIAKEVDIPASVGGKPVTAIAAYAFQNNTALISVKIPASVKSIGISAFSGCASLTTVTFSSGLTSIDNYAFLNCAKLSALKIPETVTQIGVSAFGSTAWLTAQKTAFLTGGDGVLIKYLGSDSAVTVPEGIKSMANAFYYKNSVNSVVLPSGITTIGTYAFCSCPGLKSITLPDTITAINDDAIYDCSSLAEIKVKTGSYAETWCKNKGFSAIIKNY